MNTDEIFAEIDKMYNEHRIEEVEEYMLDKLGEATKLEDENAMIQILNELIGHYRETGEFESLSLLRGNSLPFLTEAASKAPWHMPHRSLISQTLTEPAVCSGNQMHFTSR